MSPLVPATAIWAVLTPGTAGTWPDLSSAPASSSRHGRQDAAVLIAIEDYARLPDIPGARTNLDDWTRWLTTSRGVPVSRVHRLVDSRATTARMAAAMDAAAGQVGPEGTLWVVFIGHAGPGSDGLDGWLLGVDAEPSSQGLLTAGIARHDLWNRAPGVSSVWVVDASFAGPESDPKVDGLPQLRPELPVLDGQVLVVGSPDRPDGGRIPGLDRPALSYLTLGALRGWADQNGDGIVHTTEASSYVTDALHASGSADGTVWLGPDRPLSLDARENGPDLTDLLLDPLGPAELADVAVHADFIPDLAQQARWAAAAEAAEEAVLQSASSRRLTELNQRSARLAEAAQAVQDRAARDWADLAPALESGGERSADVVRAFVESYAEVRVEVDGASRWVLVPEVDLARTWLRRQARTAAARPLSPPVFADGTTTRVRDAVLTDLQACQSLVRPDACADLGVRYAEGADGLAAMPEKSVALYRRGCDHQSGLACSNLGLAYGRGLGVHIDPTKARDGFQAACDLDWGRGCGNLGLMLGAGVGGPVDIAKSLSLLVRGCDLEDGLSCHLLGSRYARGDLGAEHDPTQARTLWTKACDLGHADACSALEEAR